MPSSSTNRVLVVTDKYPPSMVGGAELSLHLLLKAIKVEFKQILVAVLDGRPPDGGDSLEGIDIVGLPSLGTWPPSQSETLLVRGIGPKTLARRIFHKEAQVRFLLNGPLSETIERVDRLRNLRKLSQTDSMKFIPTMDDDLVANGASVDALSDLVKSFAPDLVHADNYRSILTVANSDLNNVPFTAMVRDHRFFCAQKNQSANVDGYPCVSCAFECVTTSDAWSRESAQKLMSEIRAFRVRSLSKASEILTTSHYLGAQIERSIDNVPVTAVGNPVDELKQTDLIRAKVSRAKPPELLVVGMLNQNKGQARVVEWIKQLITELDDFRIVLAGRGKLAEKIIKDAEKNGVRDRLILTGFLDRQAIYRAYSRASVVIAPNRWPEPFGRVPLEAGLCERPVVAYDLGGIGESILHGVTGYLVRPRNEKDLLEKVVHLVRNPDLAEKFGKAARQHILTNFDSKLIAGRIADAWSRNIAEYSPLGVADR